MKMKDYSSKMTSETNSKLFLNLADKEAVRGIFIGDMAEHYVKWVNGKTVESNEDDPEAKVRFKCNFVVSDGGELVVKIWDFSLTVYQMLKDINEEYPLETTKLKITRNGVKTDTTYTIMPLVGPKDVLTAQQLSVIGKMRLHSLGGKPNADDKTHHQPMAPTENYEDEIPF